MCDPIKPQQSLLTAQILQTGIRPPICYIHCYRAFIQRIMIDKKISQLREITSNFLYVEYYSHEQTECWKIDNEFTAYNRDKLVLCRLDEGIEKALDLAIEHIGKRKLEFDGVSENAL